MKAEDAEGILVPRWPPSALPSNASERPTLPWRQRCLRGGEVPARPTRVDSALSFSYSRQGFDALRHRSWISLNVPASATSNTTLEIDLL